MPLLAPRHHELAVPDLSERRILLTGGSDGIGLAIATRLAAAGADLVLPVRNPSKGRIAVDRILAEHPQARITLETLDLASLASVAELADKLTADGAPIHGLVNNAGLMTPPERRTTTDGFEVQLGTNHLGHFALTGRLLPLLRAGHARVTTQTSIAAKRGSIAFDDLQHERDYDTMAAYRQSKIAGGIFGLELSRRSRERGWGITSTLAHPGVAPTNLLAAQPGVGRPEDTREVRLIRALSRRGLMVGTVESASLSALMAATSPDAVDGGFYGPQWPGDAGGPPGPTSLWKPLRDDAAARRLWEVSEELTGVTYA